MNLKEARAFLLYLQHELDRLTNTRRVSASAVGGGDGTISAPWTLTEAKEYAQPGETLLFEPGTYHR